MLAFLKLVPLRWWLYLAGAAALAGVLWHDHHQTARANQLAIEKREALAERDQARATLKTALADAALNRETSHALQSRLSDIERDQRTRPIRGVYLCPHLPSAGEGAATAGAADASTGREPGAAAEDLGPALDDYGTDCAVTAERLNALQGWEAARTH